MNEIEKARARTNKRVFEYLRANPELPYKKIAGALGVSRWRVQTVASGIGINRKPGPKANRGGSM
jgi:predicted transcriptional regulator